MTDKVSTAPRNTLLVGPQRPAAEEACLDLLSEPNSSGTLLLSVTFNKPPDYLLGLWRGRYGELPAQTGVIDVGGDTRSGTGAVAPSRAGTAPITIDTVSDPADLTGLSMAIGAYLDAWADADEPPVICFHSLSSWLSFTDELRVFRFLQAVNGRFREIGANAHFHINPDIHNQATINRFSALVDAVVHIEEDGSMTVRRRRWERV